MTMKTPELMLVVLALGVLIAVGTAQPPREGGQEHYSGLGDNHDGLNAGSMYTYHNSWYSNPSYYSWYPYPRYYYGNYWYYPTYYPNNMINYYNNYWHYPYNHLYYENGVEMRPGEPTAEWLFYHGIGEPWVGGNPPHSQN